MRREVWEEGKPIHVLSAILGIVAIVACGYCLLKRKK